MHHKVNQHAAKFCPPPPPHTHTHTLIFIETAANPGVCNLFRQLHTSQDVPRSGTGDPGNRPASHLCAGPGSIGKTAMCVCVTFVRSQPRPMEFCCFWTALILDLGTSSWVLAGPCFQLSAWRGLRGATGPASASASSVLQRGLRASESREGWCWRQVAV